MALCCLKDGNIAMELLLTFYSEFSFYSEWQPDTIETNSLLWRLCCSYVEICLKHGERPIRLFVQIWQQKFISKINLPCFGESKKYRYFLLFKGPPKKKIAKLIKVNG